MLYPFLYLLAGTLWCLGAAAPWWNVFTWPWQACHVIYEVGRSILHDLID